MISACVEPNGTRTIMASQQARTTGRSSSPRTARAVSCVRRLVNALGESARAVERHTGTTNAQLFLLRQIEREKELTINELAARALTQQSTVSLLVRKLSQAGYVHRERSPTDRRRVCVTLTARGRALARRAPDPPLAHMLSALERMPPAQVEALIRGVGALLKEMHAPAAPTPPFEPASNRPRQKRSL
jgi:DNA-binding MarR family transcriptional regulator